MQSGAVFYLLLFGLLLSASCRKEKEPCVAMLHLFVENKKEEIEWMELRAGRQDRFGQLSIDALGYNDERFTLNLQNISDTGIITGITVSQLFYREDNDFHPQRVQTGFISIVERTGNSLAGKFEIFLSGNTVALKPLKVQGSFRIFGHD